VLEDLEAEAGERGFRLIARKAAQAPGRTGRMRAEGPTEEET
jgi:hypothetical protein